MRATDPTTITPVAVTLDAAPLVRDEDYTVSWTGATGELEIDLTDGTGGETEIPSGSRLVIVYTARVDVDVGAGDTLRNIASVEFSSQDSDTEPGRYVPMSNDTGDHNTDDSTAQVQEATISKIERYPLGHRLHLHPVHLHRLG